MNNPVIFVHGDFLNHTVFKSLGKYFASKSHKIFYVDLPGHGLTPFDTKKQEAVEYLQSYIENNLIIKPIFVAHSSGCMIASDYIEKTSNFSAAIFINPLLSNPSICNPKLDIKSLTALFDKLTAENFVKQELVDYSLIKDEKIAQMRGLKTTNPTSFAHLREYYSSNVLLNKIYSTNMPVLYIASTNDTFIPIDYHEKTSGKMKNVKLVKIEASHNPFILNSELIREIIKENYDFVTL